MNNEILQVILEIALTVITLVIPVLSKYFINYFKVKSDKAKIESATEIERRLIENIGTAVYDAVAYVNQTFVYDLKKAKEFDVDKQKEALNMAVENAIETMGKDAEEFLRSNYGDINTWLVTKIEALINQKNI